MTGINHLKANSYIKNKVLTNKHYEHNHFLTGSKSDSRLALPSSLAQYRTKLHSVSSCREHAPEELTMLSAGGN